MFELLEVDDRMAQALARGDSAEFAVLAKQATGYRTLEQVALDYAPEGITSIEEAMRLSADDVLEQAPEAPDAPATPETEGAD